MLNILIAGELHPAGLKIINQNSKYSVDYLKEVSNKNFLPYLKNADAMIVRTQTLNKNQIEQNTYLTRIKCDDLFVQTVGEQAWQTTQRH